MARAEGRRLTHRLSSSFFVPLVPFYCFREQKCGITVRELAIPQTDTILPITNNNISILFDWFEAEEITLSNAKTDGEQINVSYFDEICTAVNDLLVTNEG